MITLQGIDPKMIANNLTPSNPHTSRRVDKG